MRYITEIYIAGLPKVIEKFFIKGNLILNDIWRIPGKDSSVLENPVLLSSLSSPSPASEVRVFALYQGKGWNILEERYNDILT